MVAVEEAVAKSAKGVALLASVEVVVMVPVMVAAGSVAGWREALEAVPCEAIPVETVVN